MDWKKGRLSDNVEIIQEEPRPYGKAQVARNVVSGAVSAIDPFDLNIKCSITLDKEFKDAVSKNSVYTLSPEDADAPAELFGAGELKGKTSGPPKENVSPMKVVSLRMIPESSDCREKVALFREDFKKAGLAINMGKTPMKMDAQDGAIVFTQPENQFWAGKPMPPGAGN